MEVEAMAPPPSFAMDMRPDVRPALAAISAPLHHSRHSSYARQPSPPRLMPAQSSSPPISKPAPAPINPQSREPSNEQMREHQLHRSPETRVSSISSTGPPPISRDHATMSISSIADQRPSASRTPSKNDSLADVVQQLQSQVAQNTESLSRQRQDVERIEAAIAQLQSDVNGLNDLSASIRRDLQSKSGASSAASDHAMELFATNLTTVTAKITEIDGIKMQVEILKRRVNRIEDPSNSLAPSSGYHGSPRDTSSVPAPILGSVTVSEPQQIVRSGTPGHHEIRPLPLPYHHQPQGAEASRPMEPEPQGSGWTAVNPATKRSHPNGVVGHSVGSPKRPKLAPIEPRLHMEAPSQVMYDRMETDEGETRSHSRDSFHEQGNTSNFIPYNSAREGHPEEAWRQSAYGEPRSPRRGGRGGGRGGRPRKSLPADMSELRNSEWEREGWVTQMGPDGHYYPIAPGDARRGGYVRRSSGGVAVPIARPPEMPRAIDPYAHTKKTRTKPTRNADGILIRKDGRPDMRSQSSAANLRKVHARKEQERAQEMNGQSVGSPADASAQSPSETPEDTPKEQSDQSAQDRHQAIMKQMFPHGIDEERDRRQFAAKYFPRSRSPTDDGGAVQDAETAERAEGGDSESVTAPKDAEGSRPGSRQQEEEVVNQTESNDTAPEATA